MTKDGKPFFTVGSPGGATIITTVLQTIVNRIDLGMPLEQTRRRAARQPAQLGHDRGRVGVP